MNWGPRDLCFLRQNARATKRIHTEGSDPAVGFSGPFEVFRVATPSLEVLQEVLRDHVTQDIFLINARPVEPDAATIPNRRSSELHEDGALAPYECSVLAIDFETGEGATCSDLKKLNARAMEALPSCFYGVKHLLQASSRAGLPNAGFRSRLYFLVDEPLSQALVQQALSGVRGVDHSLYNRAHCNYVATPVFDGVMDPMRGGRFAMLPGQPFVSAAALCGLAAAKAPRSRACRYLTATDLTRQVALLTDVDRNNAWDWLCDYVSDLLHERGPEGERYWKLRNAGLIVGGTSWRLPCEEDALEMLLDCVEAWQARTGGSDRGLDYAIAVAQRAYEDGEGRPLLSADLDNRELARTLCNAAQSRAAQTENPA